MAREEGAKQVNLSEGSQQKNVFPHDVFSAVECSSSYLCSRHGERDASQEVMVLLVVARTGIVVVLTNKSDEEERERHLLSALNNQSINH